jgi:hypothetical protein
MEVNREYHRESIQQEIMKTETFDITHPEWYYSGAMEFDIFLDTLQCNFQCPVNLFPLADPDKVKYAPSLLSTQSPPPNSPPGSLNHGL